jgi:broad specificity phosphatase PhoE
MTVTHFITHPEVVVDRTVPVPDWPLSPFGMQRLRRALERPWLAGVRAIFSSTERKALDAADIVAGHLGLSPVVIAGLGENDRSATGYLPKPEFEAVADAFFGRPETSVRGWERAADAQRRIIDAVERAVAMAQGDGDIAIISHGGVGALLLCHLKGVPIGRNEDQPGEGGGNVYSFDWASRRLLSGWRPIEVTT